MSDFLDRVRKSREIRVELDEGVVLLMREPTELDYLIEGTVMRRQYLALRNSIYAWQGVRQSHFGDIATDPEAPVEFDVEAFEYFAADRPKVFDAIVKAVNAARAKRVALDEENEGN